KEYIQTPMMGEEKRVRLALEKANEGFEVALVCSGDAGVYGLSGLAVEVAAEFPEVEVEVVPGVTAALSGGALLGAPLIHDFCLISLSDRLTPMDKIEARLRAAAKADLVIVLYNPESKSRSGYLSHAVDILLEDLPGDRVCGITRNIGRPGEAKEVTTLSGLKEIQADMFCTVFIGNSSSKRVGDRMVTERGYQSEG
ncbi:MAG: precorrin-3B C(17)-methyltransferase, partial [Lachnospiraceae bacterium]|nr:precorrin-3B C(17)-methyltransferase [Lachnospiraceae bacterium]